VSYGPQAVSYPSTILLGDKPAAIGWLTPLVAVGALPAAYRFWLFGLAKYQSTIKVPVPEAGGAGHPHPDSRDPGERLPARELRRPTAGGCPAHRIEAVP